MTLTLSCKLCIEFSIVLYLNYVFFPFIFLNILIDASIALELYLSLKKGFIFWRLQISWWFKPEDYSFSKVTFFLLEEFNMSKLSDITVFVCFIYLLNLSRFLFWKTSSKIRSCLLSPFSAQAIIFSG